MKDSEAKIENEIWKDIVGYEGLYQVSNLGRVKSLKRIIEGRWGKTTIHERILRERKHRKGYVMVALYKNNQPKSIKIHRLVAQAFIPNPNNLPQVNHKDENKTNNYVDNLEWCTNWYNSHYGNRIKNLCKKVNQYDMNKNFIKTWDSIRKASRTLNISNSKIGDCCHHRPHVKTAGGYIWEFYEKQKK